MCSDLKWDDGGLLPAIVQHAASGNVLMLAYMNREAFDRTIQSGETWFWSRSRQALWHKGATSGNRQRVVEILYDCDGDALLLRVQPLGPACHTGQASCFHRSVTGGSTPATRVPSAAGVLDRLWKTIADRKSNPIPESYTTRLLQEGETKILKKFGEEAMEVLLAASSESDERIVSELADLTYHSLVLLAHRGLSYEDIALELDRRAGQSPATTAGDPQAD